MEKWIIRIFYPIQLVLMGLIIFPAAALSPEKKFVWFGEFFSIKITDVLITVFTLILAIYTYQLYKATHALVKGADDTAKRQLRAYLNGWPYHITSFDEDHFAEVKYIITNYGQTPAYDMRHRCDIVLCPNPLPAGYEFPEIDTAWSPPYDLFPNTTILDENKISSSGSASRKFLSKEIADIRSKKLVICILGTIEYLDAFKEKPHTSYFTTWVSADAENLEKLTSNSTEEFDVRFATAPIGNHSD